MRHLNSIRNSTHFKMLLTWSPSKFLFISLILLAFMVDGPWNKVLRYCFVNIILNPIISIIPNSLKNHVLSSSVVGAGFNSLVYLGVKFPNIWEIASHNLLSSKAKNPLLECPPGMVAISKPYHKPSSNGCGADNVKIDKGYLPYEDQEACCNQHDICYDTCHSNDPTSKSQCDVDFKECLDRICSKKRREWTIFCGPLEWILPNWFWKEVKEHCDESIRQKREKKCKVSAHILYKFVDGLGTSAYNSAQNAACICVTEMEAIQSSYIVSIDMIDVLVFLLLWLSILSICFFGYLGLCLWIFIFTVSYFCL